MGKGVIIMKFILSRTDDREVHSKKWIVGYGLLFWIVSRIFAMLLVVGCVAVYNAFGINPESMTGFAGSPETAKNIGSLSYVLMTVCIVAPLLEECIFRLGLSFKKWQIALASASIPAYILWQRFTSLTAFSIALYVVVIVVAFILIYSLTTEYYWQKLQQKYFRFAVWGTAIAFGLIHLIAFTHYSIILVPYMLCVVTVPFAAGCTITYYRVNLGFWWGVAMHIFNNLPAIFVLLTI